MLGTFAGAHPGKSKVGINAEKMLSTTAWWNLSTSSTACHLGGTWISSFTFTNFSAHMRQVASTILLFVLRKSPLSCWKLLIPPPHVPQSTSSPKSTCKGPFPSCCFAEVFRGLELMQGGTCAGKAQFAVPGAGLAEEGRIPAPRSCSPHWHSPWVGCLDRVHQLHFTDRDSQTGAFHGKYFASELK